MKLRQLSKDDLKPYQGRNLAVQILDFSYILTVGAEKTLLYSIEQGLV